jgi:hypothetical protein
MQWSFNVIMTRVGLTMFFMDTKLVLNNSECICLGYPTWKTHAPYYIVIRDLSVTTIFFPRYLTKGTNLGEKSLNKNILFSLFLKRSLINLTF